VSRERVLIDTNVLVAVLSESDPLQGEARRLYDECSGSLVTCWPVLAESMHLLRRTATGRDALLRACANPELLEIAQLEAADVMPIRSWVLDYADQRPDFADACLVHIAERDSIRRVLSFDDDFLVYRTASGRRLHRLPS
jgi:uncharacterized protein